MKVPIAWLRRYVDLPEGTTPAALAERLASLGFPVDAIAAPPSLSGVTIGRLTAVEKHPNADRLSVCTVDVGAAEPLTIATAATNVATGVTVPVAVVGAHVVGRGEDGATFDLAIAPRTMRGVASAGMLCSAGELGLEPSWFEDGIMLLEETLRPGDDALAALGLRDGVLDVEVTANRVDALSIVGIARELAASLGVPLRAPEMAAPPAGDPTFEVALESGDCTRFVAQVFTGARDGTAPGWMRASLALAGQRPIGTLVDISNFVMIEIGQPMHFYDVAKLAGRRLVVRDAREGERLTTLDDAERVLGRSALVVADDEGALGLAGIKGGASSEIESSTTEIVLEAATFSGPRVRRTAVALGLRTEASSRHEKSLPPGLAEVAAARAARLLADLTGATSHAPVVAGAALHAPVAIRIGPADVERLVGIAVSPQELRRALESLGFEVELARGTDAAERGAWDVRAPYWRADISIVADLVEEVARVVGFDRIEAVVPPVFAHGIASLAYDREHAVARALATIGYREAVTYALVPGSVRERLERAGLTPDFASVEIRNPLSEDQRFLRFSLIPGLLQLTARHARSEPLRYFEIGHVFRGDDRGTVEELALATWVLALPRDPAPAEPWLDSGFGRFKSETLAAVRALTGREGHVRRATSLGLHPGKTASVTTATTTEEARPVAIFGAVDPRALAVFEIDRPVYACILALEALPARAVPPYVAPSRYPAVERDLALVLGRDVDAAALERAIREAGGPVVAAAHVFDDYRGAQVGEDRKSLAVRLTLRRSDATLTDADAQRVVATVLASLAERLGATVRAT